MLVFLTPQLATQAIHCTCLLHFVTSTSKPTSFDDGANQERYHRILLNAKLRRGSMNALLAMASFSKRREDLCRSRRKQVGRRQRRRTCRSCNLPIVAVPTKTFVKSGRPHLRISMTDTFESSSITDAISETSTHVATRSVGGSMWARDIVVDVDLCRQKHLHASLYVRVCRQRVCSVRWHRSG